MAQPTRIEITGNMIRLGQFLKRADAVDQGSDVKQLLATESVLVNGEVEHRRGRQLTDGDSVEVAQTAYILAVLTSTRTTSTRTTSTSPQ